MNRSRTILFGMALGLLALTLTPTHYVAAQPTATACPDCGGPIPTCNPDDPHCSE